MRAGARSEVRRGGVKSGMLTASTGEPARELGAGLTRLGVAKSETQSRDKSGRVRHWFCLCPCLPGGTNSLRGGASRRLHLLCSSPGLSSPARHHSQQLAAWQGQVYIFDSILFPLVFKTVLLH